MDFTKVLERDIEVGLGMTICEYNGFIFVHALLSHDGTRIFEWEGTAPGAGTAMGPAFKEGIRPGDQILGLNGMAFLQWQVTGAVDASGECGESSSTEVLKSAVAMIANAPDPVVIHLRRSSRQNKGKPQQRVYDNPEDDLCAEFPTKQKLSYNSTLSSLRGDVDVSPGQQPPVARPQSTKPNGIESQGHMQERKGEQNRPTDADVHPLARALSARGLLQSPDEEVSVTQHLEQYTERTRQWESTSSFRIDAITFTLRPHFDPRDLPPSEIPKSLQLEHADQRSSRSYAPSTPTISPISIRNFSGASNGCLGPFENENNNERPMGRLGKKVSNGTDKQGLLESSGLEQRTSGYLPRTDSNVNIPGFQLRRSVSQRPVDKSDLFVPLIGIRKTLCIRIVNTFLDRERTAYTIWVCDIESGTEWYAPVRYFSDFKDLRSATAHLHPSVAQIPFPTSKWNVFPGMGGQEGAESESARESRCRQLEFFLRELGSMVYKQPLHPNVSEIALHLQTFLGCDTCLVECDNPGLNLHHQVAVNETMYSRRTKNRQHDVHASARLQLKRSIQRYMHRVFLLPTLDQLVSQFVETTKANSLTANQMKALDRKSRYSLKEHSLTELKQIQNFLDQLQELLLDGCTDDLTSMSQRIEYEALFSDTQDNKHALKDAIFCESVREQIELEVYIPLRSTISRQLVNGWRHDDMEMQFKMKELRKRSQSFFKISIYNQSPSDWVSVSRILNEGVGRSSLPCAKLRAVVDAAKEITKLHADEHSGEQPPDGLHDTTPSNQVDGAHKPTLGADEFLPIFIYCVVRAAMERPCALCVLLRTLCEPSKRIGETGYYLASFEATIAHIRELDLSEGVESNQM